jgi:Predicted nucleic-acid-binding protein implicated in transcription termination
LAGAARTVQDDLFDVDPSGPERLCALTRSVHPIAELIRFVAAPDGSIVPDLSCKLPGRGVWLTCDKAIVKAAVKSGVFAKSLKRSVRAAPDLADQVELALLARTQNALSLANKAALVGTGYGQVEAMIAAGEVVALVHGDDAAEGGRDKLDRKFIALCRDKGLEPLIFAPLTIEQMSLAMGRENVVHAALKPGGAAEKFLSEARRLARFRAGSAVACDPPTPKQNKV